MNRRALVVLAASVTWIVAWAVPALADNCGTPADCFGSAGSFTTASNGLLALVGLSLLLDFLPVVGTGKGIIEAFTGRDAVTGQELAWWERALGVLPVIGGLAAVGGVMRAADAASGAARGTDRAADAADAARGADRAAEAGGAGRSGGGDAGGGSAGGGRGGGPPGPRDPHDFDVNGPEGMDPDDWFDELARDPARGGRVTPQGVAEREVGLHLQERGDLPGPIRRDPTGGSEFIDAAGQSWDVKTFHPEFPNGFDLPKIEADMRIDFRLGERYAVDTSYMSPGDVEALRRVIDANGWSDFVRWYP